MHVPYLKLLKHSQASLSGKRGTCRDKALSLRHAGFSLERPYEENGHARRSFALIL